MKKFLLPAIAISVSIFVLSLSAAHAKAATKHSTTTVDTYIVIKITDENKDESKGEKKVEYKAIASKQYKDEEKRVRDDYTHQLKKWHDERLTDPSAPRPKIVVLKKVKTGYETQEEAAKYAKKLTDDEADKDKVDQKPKDEKK